MLAARSAQRASVDDDTLFAPTTASRTIRVAFVDQAGVSAGGAERTLATLLEFMPRDIASTAILFEDGAFAQELRDLSIPVEIVAAPRSIASSSRERPRLRALLDMWSHGRRLASRLRELRIDVVYSNTMKAHFICGIAARLAGIRCIMHVHDIVDGNMMRAVRAVARVGSVERIACSQLVANALRLPSTTVSYGPIVLERYRDLPNRNVARERLCLPHDIPVVALVGRINRWKGHDRFLRIAAEVNRSMRVQFVIVGAAVFRDADFVPELEALVDKLEIRDSVSFLPWVDDVRSLYRAIDLNVNCSTREPLGRAVAEAAAAGVPSICFSDSGAAETLGDSRVGRVVPAGDERAFARAIVDVLSLPVDENRAATIRHSAVQFDAPAVAEEICTVIRRVAALGRRPIPVQGGAR